MATQNTLVTADEARTLLAREACTHGVYYVEDGVRMYAGRCCRNLGHTEPHDLVDDLYAAAPALAETVIALSNRESTIEGLIAERDRLQALLDAERGICGPPGWESTWHHGNPRWIREVADGDLLLVRRMPYESRISWRRGQPGKWHTGPTLVDAFPTFLEAMEAADAAAKAT